jgi:hypothetical protein
MLNFKAKFGTSKVLDALKSKRPVKVVTPEWLIQSNFKWEKCDENQFKLTKQYEYKHCAFHQEYNSQQKFTASTVISNVKLTATSTESAFQTTGGSGGLTSKSGDNNSSSKLFQKNESSHSLSSFETKTKKPKTAGGVDEAKKNVKFELENFDDDDNEDEDILGSGPQLNEDIFEQMDKEVSLVYFTTTVVDI